MIYTLPNIQLIDKYTYMYRKAEKDNKEKECLIGNNIKYRITTKDSYFVNISDTDAIYEYCLYPLYVNGDVKIKDNIQNRLLEMANSSDVLEIFQVYNFIISQDMLCKIYTKVPFLIDFSDIIKILVMRRPIYEQAMKIYRENGFERYRESLWDNVQRISRKSATLKKYMK